MSVNIQIAICVRSYRPEREREICAALESEMKEFESGWDVSEPASHVAESGSPEIRCRSLMPVIISGAGAWDPVFRAAVTSSVVAANGAPCAVEITLDYE